MGAYSFFISSHSSILSAPCSVLQCLEICSFLSQPKQIALEIHSSEIKCPHFRHKIQSVLVSISSFVSLSSLNFPSVSIPSFVSFSSLRHSSLTHPSCQLNDVMEETASSISYFLQRLRISLQFSALTAKSFPLLKTRLYRIFKNSLNASIDTPANKIST